ncbi:MAG: TIGR02530 family flagellar biosynthesis protein [bacterium]
MNKVELIQPTPIDPGRGAKVAKSKVEGKSFGEVLQEVGGGLKFSAHARERLEKRRINLTPQDVQRMRDAVDRAEGKGSKEALILLKETAFIVSVKNRTVITALDKSQMKENVFTNIDSAVVL